MTQLSPRTVNPDRSKAERVYRELRRRIRELTLPPGALLRKEEIALEMGVRDQCVSISTRNLLTRTSSRVSSRITTNHAQRLNSHQKCTTLRPN